MKNKFILLGFIFSLCFNMNVFACEENSSSQFEEVKNSPSQSELLQMVALAEAQDDGVEQVAFVMQTIMNRVESGEFPDTIEEVIMQEGQFSTYETGKYNDYPPNEISEKAMTLLYTMENKGQMFFTDKQHCSWHLKHLSYMFEFKGHIYFSI